MHEKRGEQLPSPAALAVGAADAFRMLAVAAASTAAATPPAAPPAAPPYTLLIGQNSLSQYNDYSRTFSGYANGPSTYLSALFQPPMYHPFCCANTTTCYAYLADAAHWQPEGGALQDKVSPAAMQDTSAWAEPPSHLELALYLTTSDEAHWDVLMGCITARPDYSIRNRTHSGP